MQDSCQDKFQISFNEQIVRLKQAGYPKHTIFQRTKRCANVLKPIEHEQRMRNAPSEQKKYPVRPYTYREAHGLKNAA